MKASKTNPFRQGVTLYVGVTNLLLCLLTMVLSFMVVRGNRPKPLFIGEDGKYLTREIFVTEVQLALRGHVTQQKNTQVAASALLLCSYNSR